jgi:hypothetical protein
MTDHSDFHSTQNCHWNNDNFARRADESLSANDLSGLTPTLKPSEVLILNKAHKPLGFNVGPEGKNGLTTFLGSKKNRMPR